MISGEELAELIRHLKLKWQSINEAYVRLPCVLDTPSKRRRKEVGGRRSGAGVIVVAETLPASARLRLHKDRRRALLGCVWIVASVPQQLPPLPLPPAAAGDGGAAGGD